MPDANGFALRRALLADVAAVGDASIMAAMRLVCEVMKIVIKPGAAMALSAVR
jgi:threonine dehydratase